MSPEREGDAGDVLWSGPRTAEVVDGGCPKRRRAQFYGPGPECIGATVSSNTEESEKGRRCDEAPQTNSPYTAKSVADVIFTDDSDKIKVSSAVDALMNPVAMNDGGSGPVLLESMEIDSSGRAITENTPFDDLQDEAWDIRDYFQFCVRTKFPRTSIDRACDFLSEVTIPFMEGLLWDARKLKE